MTVSPEQREAWCQPVSSGSFGGEPSRYDEKYELVLVELAKLDSLTGEVCDWGKVYTAADLLVRTKTKDLTLLGALCVALLKKEGFAGLALGLSALQWLLENHSDEMFPKPQRQRGRAGAYTWLTERLIRELESAQAQAADLSALETVASAFAAVDGVLRDQLGELHPRVGSLNRRLQELVQQAQSAAAPEPEEAAPPEPADEPRRESSRSSDDDDQEPKPEERQRAPEPPAAAAPARGLIPASIEDAAQARAALEAVVPALRRMAVYYLRDDKRSGIGYQLAHLAAFLGVLPDGERAVPGTSPRRLRAMQEAAADRRWSYVIDQVPQILEEGGDLDLNAERCLSEALQGEGHELALATINSHAACSFRLLGDLVAAGAETVAWLQDLGGGGADQGGGDSAGGDAASSGEGSGSEPDALAEVIAEAQGATRRSLEAGCAVIQDALRREGKKSARLRLQLALAGLCLSESAADLARPILRHLYQELEAPIRSWETDLMVQVIGGLLECHRQLERDDRAPAGAEQEIEQLMAALTEIDPQSALRERGKNLPR